MSSRLLRASLGCAIATIPFFGPAALGQVEVAETPAVPSGVAFSELDPDGAIREAVGAELGARIVERVRRDTARAGTWTETMFSALAAVSSELNALDREGRLDGPSRHEIGALAVIAVVDVVVDQHPELAPALSGDSPIERMCACDRSGSLACGCSVWSTGPGSCNYRVLCNSWVRAACSAVNLDLCIARTVSEIVSPFHRDLWRSDAPEARPTRAPARTR